MNQVPAPGRLPADESSYWRSNLYICMLGSFSTFMGMTLTFPFLSLYIQALGVLDSDDVIRWSAIAYVVTFAVAIFAAPIWGNISDRFGNQFTLLRASLGMSIVIFCMGLVQDVYQLVGTRVLLGLVGGYSSGAIILVSKQTPRIHSAWALSMLSSSALAGNLLGPLLGGVLSELVGLRYTFFLSSCIIFFSFILTRFFIIEIHQRPLTGRAAIKNVLLDIRDIKAVILLFISTLLILSSYMSIEPFISVYILNMVGESGKPALIVGLAISSTALGSITFSPFIGLLSKKIGPLNLIVLCLFITGCLLIPQAYVATSLQFISLRFLMGLTLAGLIPTITMIISDNISPPYSGTLLGWLMSAQYLGQILGPLTGGIIATKFDIGAVFIATAFVLIATGIIILLFVKVRTP